MTSKDRTYYGKLCSLLGAFRFFVQSITIVYHLTNLKLSMELHKNVMKKSYNSTCSHFLFNSPLKKLCLVPNLETLKGIDLKLKTKMDDMKENCNMQEP